MIESSAQRHKMVASFQERWMRDRNRDGHNLNRLQKSVYPPNTVIREVLRSMVRQFSLSYKDVRSNT